MKTRPTHAIGSLVAIMLAACDGVADAQTTWTNFLRQRQVGSGVELQVEVAQNGSRPALLPMEAQGADFQIWTLKSGAGNTPVLLDSKFVNAYQLASTIQIVTADPYQVIPRTRVDQPFTVRVNVAGLQTGTVEDAARMVALRHDVATLPPGVRVAPADLARTNIYNGFISQNGWYTLAFNAANIIAPNLAEASGEEYFTVSALAGFKSTAAVLATAKVQVWPLASASASGIAAGMTYKAMPEVSFHFNDLYPVSTTWAQVYPGAPLLGVTGTTIPATVTPINDTTPQERTVILREWSSFVPTEGPWTMEVLHTTPFGTERLTHVSFNVSKTIEIHGQIYSSE